MIVLDTHVLIWWTQQPEMLSPQADGAIKAADRIVVCAISFWETALLVRKGRLRLRGGLPVSEWMAAVCSIPRVVAAALTPQIAIAADGLAMHDDPADRFISATVLDLEASLLTKDRLLHDLEWLQTVW